MHSNLGATHQHSVLYGWFHNRNVSTTWLLLHVACNIAFTKHTTHIRSNAHLSYLNTVLSWSVIYCGIFKTIVYNWIRFDAVFSFSNMQNLIYCLLQKSNADLNAHKIFECKTMVKFLRRFELFSLIRPNKKNAVIINDMSREWPALSQLQALFEEHNIILDTCLFQVKLTSWSVNSKHFHERNFWLYYVDAQNFPWNRTLTAPYYFTIHLFESAKTSAAIRFQWLWFMIFFSRISALMWNAAIQAQQLERNKWCWLRLSAFFQFI